MTKRGKLAYQFCFNVDVYREHGRPALPRPLLRGDRGQDKHYL